MTPSNGNFPITIAGKTFEDPEALPDTFEFPLRQPLKLGDQDIQLLSLREPNGEEISAFQQDVDKTDPTQALYKMLASIAGIPPRLAGKIGSRDLKQIGDYFAAFTNAGPVTGASISQS